MTEQEQAKVLFMQIWKGNEYLARMRGNSKTLDWAEEWLRCLEIARMLKNDESQQKQLLESRK